MKAGLVLGGGGLVGMAYHAGVLKALDDWGLDVGAADLLIGTSAGSVMASYLAAGWSPNDFFDYAHGKHPAVMKEPRDPREQMKQIFTPAWKDQRDRVRRSLGSAFAVVSSRGYLKRITPGGPSRGPSDRLRKAFPAGMYKTEVTRQRLTEELPHEWPERDVFICTVDLYSGERVAFGAPGAPDAPFPDAVLASTAIPGVFPPVRINDRHYVDGGVASATSLDLATDQGCDVILCIAPLGYRSDGIVTARDPRMWPPMLMRSLFARSLRREVRAARDAGRKVMVIRPWLTDLAVHGTNSMRMFDRGGLATQAREGTLRLLDERADDPVLLAWARRPGRTRRKVG